MLGNIKAALLLLDRRSKRILLVLVVSQIALAGMDLAGVLLIGLVAALGASAVSGETPAVVDQILSRVGLSEGNETAVAIALSCIAALLLITKSTVSFLLIRRSLGFLANRQAMISSELAERLLSRPLLEVQRRSSQQTAYILTVGVNAATIGVIGNVVIAVSEMAVLVALAAGLLLLDPLVAIFTVAFFAGVGFILNRALGHWAKRLGARLASAEVASYTAVQEALRSYREMTVTGRSSLVVSKFRRLRWEAARVQADNQTLGQVSKTVFEIALIVGAAVLAFSQFHSRDVVAAVAVIAVFLTAASRVTPSMLRLQQALLGIRSSVGVAEAMLQVSQELTPLQTRVEGVLQAVPEVDAHEAHATFDGSIRIDNVSLTYPGASSPAVESVTLFIPPTHSLAIVGPTGAGKSTIADLVLGILRPDSGEVLISGISPQAAIQRWPGALGYVPQDIGVVDGTIRENVALGLPRDLVDDSLVWESLAKAHLAQTLVNASRNLDSQVGEYGVQLSGGQRQRLGLARALYTRPRLLVLDEATSALDAETERAVTEALRELSHGTTLVVIAHRLATIKNSNLVAYIENGRLLASGTFDEVRAAEPRFDQQAQILGL